MIVQETVMVLLTMVYSWSVRLFRLLIYLGGYFIMPDGLAEDLSRL